MTGAAQGVGKAIVARLTAEGARVAALDLHPLSAPETGAALSLACDVANSHSVAQAIAKAREAFGRLDIAVNNAGIGRAPCDGSENFYAAMARRNAELAEKGQSDVLVDQLIHMEDSGWAAVMAVNINGPFYVAREFTRILARDGNTGSIIYISSTSAQSG